MHFVQTFRLCMLLQAPLRHKQQIDLCMWFLFGPPSLKQIWHLVLPSSWGGTLLALFCGGGNGDVSRDDDDCESWRLACRWAAELSLDAKESWLDAESKDADDSDRGIVVRLLMYGFARDFPSSSKFRRIDFTFVRCQSGFTSLKIINAFNAEM